MHPLYTLLAVVGIVTGLLALRDRAPLWMPVVFAASLLSFAGRAIYLMLRRRRESGADIDFSALHRMDLSGKVPWVRENLRGQDAVVERIAAKIQQNLALASPHRTLGAFLLVGPTGTGKTYLGELLAKTIFPAHEALILRMNQYKDHQDVFTLLGPPPGHAGYEVGGALTRPVLEQPNRVLILDEFDKAHPDVRHCFYDILDRGQTVEKSSGKTVHFNACVFVATCNAGVESLRKIWAEVTDPSKRSGRARDALAREGFEKALLARFDDILLMDQLDPVIVAEVACLQIAKHWRQYGIEVTYASPEVLIDTVKRNAEFQEYGVRQLAHLIQEITTPLIETARRGGSTRVRLDLDPETGKISAAAS